MDTVAGANLITILFLFFVIVGLSIYTLTIYNELIRLRNETDRAWADIDVLLKQRHDQVPNLVATCKGYMQHEQAVFQMVAEARSAYASARTIGEKAQANDMATGALRTLFGVAESYPKLKASALFLQLQTMIADLEERIADRREYFNDAIATYNTRIRQLPDSFFATLAGMTPREFFRATDSERVSTTVEF
jgi:LemA protein